MAKKRSKNPKFLNIFGIKLDYKDYVERFLPEQVEALTKLYRKQGYEWDLKYTTKSKGKYWDTKQSYPTNQNDFIKKFFKNKKPKEIEGIWQQQYFNQTITYGIVKEGKVYNAFFIKRGHFKQSTGSMLKDIFGGAKRVDYSILQGTKFGTFMYTKDGSVNDNQFLKFKGSMTVLNSFTSDEPHPVIYELEYNVTQIGDYELRGESRNAKLGENLGVSRSSYKIWPEQKILRGNPNPGKDHPGFTIDSDKIDRDRRKSVHEEIWVQCSDTNCKDYSNHFQIRKASLRFRVCPECRKELKLVKGKINPNSQNSNVVDPKEDKENKRSGSFGSGFFVTDKGHIITNYHVVNDSNNIKFLYNDEEVDAKLVASDHQLDLALLKSKIKNKSYIKFSNKSPQKAQNILVAGFPFGKVISDDLKVTGGIINSLKGGGNDTTRFQLDATVNPGNSGGPIVDKLSGSLVGVAVTKLNKDFTKAAFGVEGENTNYGIKASQVKDFLEANNLKVSFKKSKFKISDLENSTVFIYNK